MKDNYNNFWDSFDTIKYEELLKAKNDKITFRVNDEIKKEFEGKAEKYGGKTSVITQFMINFNKNK